MKNIVIVYFLMAGSCLYGQNIRTETLQWNSVSTFKVNEGMTIMENTTVVTDPDHIEWRASNGVLLHTLHLLETNGTWTDIKNNGEVLFEIDHDGKRGTVYFSQNAEGVKIKMMLFTTDPPEIFELAISNTEKL